MSYVSDSGDICIVGSILLDRFKLTPSSDALDLKLFKCTDDTASCKIVVNGVEPVEYLSPRKRFDSFDIPKNGLTPVTLNSANNSFYNKSSQGGKTTKSRITSPKSVVGFSSEDL